MLSGFTPNGLLSNKGTFVSKVLDQDRWSRAEARAAELLTYMQPNPTSEQRRNAIVSYLQRLIMKCIPCKLFVVGSVPLKTYLPDGDIDLTAFGDNQNLEDSLVQEMVHLLEREEKNEDAEFRVKEVQYIQAEVKIIKCLVENIVVDISFNQLGALCTLCFLEEVDSWIRQNHLFKRSVILIKAWCYHESRILGSQHGLISTYALEILVLYIFHVYSNTFAGPLEVLYRFLEFYSKFDWNEYCVSLEGPVPISSLPNMRAEPPRKDCQELLLTEAFLNACKSCYGVLPSSQENEEQPFVSKCFNIIDPLRMNNNLGRSINKGNFFRIRSAIAFGAQRVMRMLNFPEENLIAEFDFFFKNTWDRHGKGYWIDLSIYNLYLRNSNVEDSTCHESEVEQAQASQGSDDIHQKPTNHLKEESTHMFGTSDASSGPEFAHTYNSEVPTQHSSSSMTDNSSRSSSTSEVLENHNVRVSSENQQSFGQIPYVPSFESFWGQSMPYSHGLVPFPELQLFPSVGMTLNQEEVTEAVNYNVVVAHLDHEKQMAAANGASSSASYSVDNQSLLPFPFPTMFPIYNVPAETGSTSTANNCMDMDGELVNLHARGESSVVSDSTEKFHVSHVSYDATSESFVTQSSDILDGDFLSYWLNLQYGRFCQNERMAHDPPLVMAHDPPIVMAHDPPLVMDHDPPLVPITPVESVSDLHVAINQSVAFWLPRSSDGTGAYIPNPITYHQRYYRRNRGRRNQRRCHKHDGEREENWDFNHGDRSHQLKPGTNEASRRGEGSHGAFNKLANFRRDSA